MTTIFPSNRKQRTREHIIANQSVNYLERVILDEGHAVQRLGTDYGYDLILYTFDTEGYIEPGIAYFQLKASDHLRQSREYFVFDLDVRDYNLWMLERVPVFLVLFDARRRKAYWVEIQHFFQEDVASETQTRG